MSNLLFTADTHFFHGRIIDFCKRPFQHVEEMHEVMVERWNKKVKKGDLVYHLGDFAYKATMEQARKIRSRLNGEILLVLGNHDQIAQQCQNVYPFTFKHVSRYMEVSQADGKSLQEIVLFHYGMRTWHHDLRGVWHLYGHSHGGLAPYGKSFDIGVDNWNFEPQSFEEVRKEMATREIGKHPQFENFKAEEEHS